MGQTLHRVIAQIRRMETGIAQRRLEIERVKQLSLDTSDLERQLELLQAALNDLRNQHGQLSLKEDHKISDVDAALRALSQRQ